jgi:hypothetical protein
MPLLRDNRIDLACRKVPDRLKSATFLAKLKCGRRPDDLEVARESHLTMLGFWCHRFQSPTSGRQDLAKPISGGIL